MSRILLDTHLLLWAVSEPRKLTAEARRWIDESEVFVSAAAVALLPSLHNDSFDRILVAQAKTEPLLLLTNDAALQAYGDCVKFVAAKARRR